MGDIICTCQALLCISFEAAVQVYNYNEKARMSGLEDL